MKKKFLNIREKDRALENINMSNLKGNRIFST